MPGTTATRDALRCVRCRYALEALPAGGACPECGLAVAESAHRREVHAIRRLRAVRVGAVAWIVGVVAWALTIVPPMLGLLLHGFGSMAVLRASVTVAMLVQTIAGGLALALCVNAVVGDATRPRRWMGWAAAAIPVGTGLTLSFAMLQFRSIAPWSMFTSLCCGWTAAVVTAWMLARLHREFRPDARIGWLLAVLPLILSDAVLVVSMPLELLAPTPAPSRFVPVRWAIGLHAVGLACSVPLAVPCLRAAGRELRARLPRTRGLVRGFETTFAQIRARSEQAIAQLDATAIRRSLDGEVNSVAVILKHVGGNLRSRFTDFLHADGEKSWRDREAEFVDDFPDGEAGREAALAAWSEGWGVLERVVASLHDEDLRRTVRIRGEAHTVAEALERAVSHLSYHQGQITLAARMLVGPESWKTITIPRGGSAAHDAAMGFDPRRS